MGSTEANGNPHTNAHCVRLDVNLHGKVMVQHNGVVKKVEVAYYNADEHAPVHVNADGYSTHKTRLVSL